MTPWWFVAALTILWFATAAYCDRLRDRVRCLELGIRARARSDRTDDR
jgi:hypothetical protein